MIRLLPDFTREVVCDGCGAVIERFLRRPTGRPRRWCSDACRMRASRGAREKKALPLAHGVGGS